MPARKGDRPFVGLTNDARKKNATARREAILLYLRELDGRIPVKQLAADFCVGLRTIMYDLQRLYDDGYAEELRPKFLESAHSTITHKDALENSGESREAGYTLSDIRRGNQLRSGGIHYPDLISFSRGRMSYREYQVLDVVKKAQGKQPRALYEVYCREYHAPVGYESFRRALYRLVSLRRVYTKPISAKRQIYFAYSIPPKTLECGWGMPAPGTEARRQSNHLVANYSSYVGKSASKLVLFRNNTKNKLAPIKQFRIEFNKQCDCGGSIMTAKDGAKYCLVCGLVVGTAHTPGIENISVYVPPPPYFIRTRKSGHTCGVNSDTGTLFDRY